MKRNFSEACIEYNRIVPLLDRDGQNEIIDLVVKEMRRLEKLGLNYHDSRHAAYEMGIAETERRLRGGGYTMQGAEEYEEILAAQNLMLDGGFEVVPRAVIGGSAKACTRVRPPPTSPMETCDAL